MAQRKLDIDYLITQREALNWQDNPLTFLPADLDIVTKANHILVGSIISQRTIFRTSPKAIL